MLPHIDVVRCDDCQYLLLHSPDIITHELRTCGRWGEAEIIMCTLLTRGVKGAAVLDIGAHIGSFSVPVARHLQNVTGNIFCFEPQRVVFQHLCANLFINRLDNAYTYNVAVGNADTEMLIPELDFETSQNIGGFSLQYFEKQQESNGFLNNIKKKRALFPVQQVRLDDLTIPEKVSFVKVDVEGYELEVFQGAIETIKKNNYPPISFEVWDYDWYRDKANETKYFLRRLGYALENILNDCVLAQHPSRKEYLKVIRIEDGTIFRLRTR